MTARGYDILDCYIITKKWLDAVGRNKMGMFSLYEDLYISTFDRESLAPELLKYREDEIACYLSLLNSVKVEG